MGKIIWSDRAKNQRGNVFRYWNKRNGNKAYSQKLNTEINKTILLLSENPSIENEIDFSEDIRRILVLSNCSIFYTIIEDMIYILSFWDNRQNPEELQL